MQRRRGELVPIGEVFGGMNGPVKAIRRALRPIPSSSQRSVPLLAVKGPFFLQSAEDTRILIYGA